MNPDKDYAPQPLHDQPIAPEPLKRGKRAVFLRLALVVLGLFFATNYIFSGPVAAPKPSVVLYYSDGKTVLWRNDNTSGASKQPKMTAYFVDMARAELRKKYGQDYGNQGAWKVTTTLDVGLQAKAEQLVHDNLVHIANATQGKADAEALVLQDVHTGQLKALVGGVDYTNRDYGQINFVTTPLQPGSSIKPLDYAALIENTDNTGAGSMVNDVQEPIPSYPCTNKAIPNKATPREGGNCLFDFDFLYPGPMPLRYALGGSRNVPAVKAAFGTVPNDTSPGHVDSINTFRTLLMDMGATSGYSCYSDEALTQRSQCYGAAALGDGAYMTLADELHVLATLANNGTNVPQTTLHSATLNGKTKADWRQPAGQQIIKKDTAYIINDIMSDPNASYLPGSCDANNCSTDANSYKFHRYNGWKFAVNTGTVNDGYSGNMASWSSQYAVISWVGNHSRNQALNTSMETLTKPLTQGMMQAAHAHRAPHNWVKPDSIQTLPAFVITNHLHYGDVEPSPSLDIYPSWYK